MKIQLEKTDTYQGESNYSWVKREEITLPDNASDLAIMRKVKEWAGWNGLRCKVVKHYDMWDIRPYGICNVLFVTFYQN